VLRSKASSTSVICSRRTHDLCHACQLGHHTHIPFVSSASHADSNFDLIHCDLWTSPIVSISGCNYYLVIPDDHSHFVWTFLLCIKSNTFPILSIFFVFISTQFGHTIKAVQYDNGHEFYNASSCAFFVSNGVILWMSYPYTSSQNGKVNRSLPTINNITRFLLFQAFMPARYW
jgi:transposase InsO family protein